MTTSKPISRKKVRPLDRLRARVRFFVTAVAFFVTNVILGAVCFAVVWFAPDWAYWKTGVRAMRWYMRAAGIRVRARGLDRLRPDRTAVYVCNHLSYFDIAAAMAALPVRFHFVAKRELVKIPIFGWALGPLKMILIDRSTTEKAYESIRQAARRIAEEQRDVLVYPEGQISKTGRLQPFKKGAFNLAIEAQVPIVPMVVRNSDNLFSLARMECRPGFMEIEVLPEIATAGLTEKDRDVIMEKTHRAMAEALEENETHQDS